MPWTPVILAENEGGWIAGVLGIMAAFSAIMKSVFDYLARKRAEGELAQEKRGKQEAENNKQQEENKRLAAEAEQDRIKDLFAEYEKVINRVQASHDNEQKEHKEDRVLLSTLQTDYTHCRERMVKMEERQIVYEARIANYETRIADYEKRIKQLEGVKGT